MTAKVERIEVCGCTNARLERGGTCGQDNCPNRGKARTSDAESLTDTYIEGFRKRAAEIVAEKAAAEQGEGSYGKADEANADLMLDCVEAIAAGGIAHPAALCAAALGRMGDPAEDYPKLFEGLSEEYGPRILDLLREIREQCKARGMFATEPVDASCDDYRWELGVWRTPEQGLPEQCVVVSVALEEEREYEGGESWGMSFSLVALDWSGRTVAELRPFNYTDECWTDARIPGNVSERWQFIEDSSTEEVAHLIQGEESR